MRRKWILLQGIYPGSADCDLDENDYRMDRRGNGFNGWENGSDSGLHLLFVEIDPLCVKESLLRDKAGLLWVEDP
jgi:hypothetical protein